MTTNTHSRNLNFVRDAVHDNLKDVLKPEAINKELVFVDTETTGLFHNRDRIIEIGAIKFSADGDFIGIWHHYFDPCMSIPDEAAKVHGISNAVMKEMVADGRAKPLSAKSFNDFLSFIGDATFIAHNATFDIKFLEAEAGRLNKVFQPHHVIDTLPLARVRFPRKKINLDMLCKTLNVKTTGREDFHGAMVDAVILSDLFVELIKPDAHFDMLDMMLAPPQENVMTSPHVSDGVLPLRSIGEATREEKRIHQNFISTKIRKVS